MKKLTFALSIFLFSSTIWAQDSLVDPMVNIKSYTTFDFGFYAQSPNTDNVQFGDYTLPQGIYKPTIHSAIFWHRTLLLEENEPLFKLKTGLLFNSYYTNLTDNNGANYYFSEADISLAFLVGTHLPIKYNSVKDKFFKAIDMNFGMYMGTPFIEHFTLEENKYSEEGQYWGFNYMKFGLIAEIEYSAITKNGYGHRIGLRTMVDLNSIWKFKNSESGIYPSFTSIGIFYNFWTMEVVKH